MANNYNANFEEKQNSKLNSLLIEYKSVND